MSLSICKVPIHPTNHPNESLRTRLSREFPCVTSHQAGSQAPGAGAGVESAAACVVSSGRWRRRKLYRLRAGGAAGASRALALVRALVSGAISWGAVVAGGRPCFSSFSSFSFSFCSVFSGTGAFSSTCTPGFASRSSFPSWPSFPSSLFGGAGGVSPLAAGQSFLA